MLTKLYYWNQYPRCKNSVLYFVILYYSIRKGHWKLLFNVPVFRWDTLCFKIKLIYLFLKHKWKLRKKNHIYMLMCNNLKVNAYKQRRCSGKINKNILVDTSWNERRGDAKNIMHRTNIYKIYFIHLLYLREWKYFFYAFIFI